MESDRPERYQDNLMSDFFLQEEGKDYADSAQEDQSFHFMSNHHFNEEVLHFVDALDKICCKNSLCSTFYKY